MTFVKYRLNKPNEDDDHYYAIFFRDKAKHIRSFNTKNAEPESFVEIRIKDMHVNGNEAGAAPVEISTRYGENLNNEKNAHVVWHTTSYFKVKQSASVAELCRDLQDGEKGISSDLEGFGDDHWVIRALEVLRIKGRIDDVQASSSLGILRWKLAPVESSAPPTPEAKLDVELNSEQV